MGVNGTTAEPKMRMATSMVTVGLAAVATGGLVLALAEGGGACTGPWGGGEGVAVGAGVSVTTW